MAESLVGRRFGLWTVIGYAQPGGFQRRWLCRCDCGAERPVLAFSLLAGKSQGCGCTRVAVVRQRITKHGATTHAARSRAYAAWISAKSRCFNPKMAHWHRYGGRGITMCDAWRNDFPAFLREMGECPPGLTLDRVNNDGHYEPGNCRWASMKEQGHNRSTTKERYAASR
jgi:hypothetical protein